MVKAGDEISTDPQIEAYLEIGVGAGVLDRCSNSAWMSSHSTVGHILWRGAVQRYVSTAQKASHLPRQYVQTLTEIIGNAERDCALPSTHY